MRKTAPLVLLVVAAVAIFLFFRNSPTSEHDKPPGAAATSTARPGGKGPAPGPTSADNGGTASTGRPAPSGQKLFFAKWGSGDDELGRDRPMEAAPTGPMSFGVDAKGRMVVLDSANGRLVRRGADGKVETMRIGVMDPQDMATAPDGSTAVLDRYADKSVAVFDESGNLRGELPLEGEGVDDVGSVTGVFVDGSDVFVEREHGPLVQIGTTSGQPVEPRIEIPGRPTRDGLSFIKAGIVDPNEGRVYVASIDRATVTNRFTRELRLLTFVRQIVLLDSDKTGMIYFAAEVESADGSEAVLLNCLEPLKGAPAGSAVLPANTMPEETFRDFTVLDEGGVVIALRTEQGVSYIKYDCE
jgi:hypothetical protein